MPGDVMLLCAAVIWEALAAVPDSPVPTNVQLLADRMSRDLPRFLPATRSVKR